MVDTATVSTKEQSLAQVLIGGDQEELPKGSKTSGSFYTLARKMRLHPTISLARDLAIAPLLSAEWSIKELDGAPPDAKAFFEQQILPLKFHLLETSLFGCMDFGWQPYEKVFKLDETTKLITIDKLKPLLQDKTTIQIDIANGSFNGFKQGDLILKLQDSLLVNWNVEGTDWYGNGRMAVAQKPYDEWNNCNDAAVRYDKKLAGAHWVVHYPPGSTTIEGVETDNLTTANNILRALQSSGQIAIPRKKSDQQDDSVKADDGWAIELLSAYPTSNVAFIERLKYQDALMARSFGLPERAVLEGQFGTKAEAEAHADFAITNMELRHAKMVLQYNWHLINQLLTANWGAQFANTVRIEVAPITDVSLSFLRQLFNSLVPTPAFAQLLATVDGESLADRLSIPIKSNEQAIADATKAPDQIAASFINNFLGSLSS